MKSFSEFVKESNIQESQVNEAAIDTTLDKVIRNAISSRYIEKSSNVFIIVDGSGSMIDSDAVETIVEPMYDAFSRVANSVSLGVIGNRAEIEHCNDIDNVAREVGRHGGTVGLNALFNTISELDADVVYYVTDEFINYEPITANFNPDQNITIVTGEIDQKTADEIGDIENPDANVTLVEIPFDSFSQRHRSASYSRPTRR